ARRSPEPATASTAPLARSRSPAPHRRMPPFLSLYRYRNACDRAARLRISQRENPSFSVRQQQSLTDIRKSGTVTVTQAQSAAGVGDLEQQRLADPLRADANESALDSRVHAVLQGVLHERQQHHARDAYGLQIFRQRNLVSEPRPHANAENSEIG